MPTKYHAKRKNFAKKNLVLFLAWFEPTTCQSPIQEHNQLNQIHICDYSYNFRNLSSHQAFNIQHQKA